MKSMVMVLLAWLILPMSSLMAATPSPEGAKVFIIQPQDGATVESTFKVVFGLEGMQLAPAGTYYPNTGHHHLFIDVDELPDLTLPLPATGKILHFGQAQSEAYITLPAGEHTLQLVLGDGNHVPHDKPVVSKVIKVKVAY